MYEYWIKDEKNNIDLLLPVSLPEYESTYGNDIEVIKSTNLGDINIVGHKKLETIILKCFFPEQEYIFSKNSESKAMDYVNIIKKWIDEKSVVRLIISDDSSTKVNNQYYIENIGYGEDGESNKDINYTITLREYRQMHVKDIISNSVIAVNKNKKRESVKSTPKSKKYTVQKGDNLNKIARKMYGDASKWKKIYDANKSVIGKNPNIIYAGQVFNIP